MKKLILLLILALCPVYSWAACTGTNYGDVSMTNLPEKILVNAGSYTAGTVLYDSGKITRSQTELLNCEGEHLRGFCLVLEQCRGTDRG